MKLLEQAFAMTPVEEMNVPDWADTMRHLPHTSRAGGLWKTSRVEMARGPMMAWTEPGVERLSLCFAVQSGKSELLLNIIGRTAHLDPSPVMLVQPKREAADKFSRERLAPMLSESPVLRALFDQRERSGYSSLSMKAYRGGFIACESAGSPMDLASRAIRYVLMDEIDKYESTKEGEPVALAEARMATWGAEAKSVRCCSPTNMNSRIWQSYQESDRRRAFIKCESCGWEMSPKFFKDVTWEKTATDHFPATATINCEKCQQPYSEDWRRKQVTSKLGIRWKQTRNFNCCGEDQDPLVTQCWEWDDKNQIGRAKCTQCGALPVSNAHAGYAISQLFSPFTTVVALATEWIRVKDNPEDKMTFRNSRLGEPADIAAVIENVQIADLLARRVMTPPKKIPNRIVFLAAGVDVQSGSAISFGSLHAYIYGFESDFTMHSISTRIIEGDIRGDVLVWEQLEQFLSSTWPHESGGNIRVQAACVDAGDGNMTEVVKAWCRPRFSRHIWATKGKAEAPGTAWVPAWPGPNDEEKRTQGFRLKVIGANSAKLAIYQKLDIPPGDPGCMIFGADWTAERFAQLTAETLSEWQRGDFTHRRFVLPRGRANEALDCTAYALTALYGWLALGNSLEKNAARIAQQTAGV